MVRMCYNNFVCLQDTSSTLESDHIQPLEVRFVAAYRLIVLNYTSVHVCAAGLCVWSHQFVYIYVYMWPKNWLFEFEVLPLKNLSLHGVSTACSSSLTTKKGAYYAR